MEIALNKEQTINNSLSMGMDLDVKYDDRHRVLVVEDEADTVFLLKQILRIAGFNVMSAMDGKEALRKIIDYQPDLVLLDLMLPEMDGWETLSHIRQMGEIPVIIVSALTSKDDILMGFRAGGDDYVTKPFYNAELTARIQAVLRRSHRYKELNRLVYPYVGLIIDLTTEEVIIDDHPIHLTHKEFAILSLLAKKSPAVVNYSQISQAIWGMDGGEIRKRTKYLVYCLRRKFEEAKPGIDLIQNMDRLGYKLRLEPYSE